MILYIDEKRRKFLENLGFIHDYVGEPSLSMMGTVTANMDVFKRIRNFNIARLYIHYSSNEPPYCNLYYNESEEAEYFSYRNLISEMKKRGFGNDDN